MEMMGAKDMKQYEVYIERLEEERKKIQVFARELPLCLNLVTQAIEACKQQMATHSQCSEQTTSEEGPVLEEFIPMKKSSYDHNNVDNGEEDDEDEHVSHGSEDEDEKDDKLSKKSDWLRSVQLWNQTPDPSTKQDSPKKEKVVEVKKNGGGAFHPFKREKISDSTITAKLSIPVASAASSSGESGGCSGGGGGGSRKKEDKDGQRKARRCWSPELHRCFLQALQQLGGSHAATPKQIRELMKVDGLTNDEVKSHLQKYRLHTRRPNPSIQNNNNPQPTQFLVVSGIWVPPPEYAVATTTAGSGEASDVSVPNIVYAPIAAPPPAQDQQYKKSKHFHSKIRASLSKGGGRCSSSATSSSTHTSPASPAC